MKIISKEEIDRQNELEYTFFEDSNKVLNKVLELRKIDQNFTPNENNVNADSDLKSLVDKAKQSAQSINITFDPERQLNIYLNRIHR